MTQLEKITFNQIKYGDVLLALLNEPAQHGFTLWRSGIAAKKHNNQWFTPTTVSLASMGDTIYRITKGELKP